MDAEQIQALAKVLGVAADADGPAIIDAATALATASRRNVGVITATCAALGVSQDARPEDISAAVLALKNISTDDAQPDPACYVTMAAHKEVSAQLKAMQDTMATDRADAVVEKAMAAGKITPANKDWALALATKDQKSFDDFVANAPVIVVSGESAPGGAPQTNSVEIATSARAYQTSMATQGVTISTSDAVDHVMKGSK